MSGWLSRSVVTVRVRAVSALAMCSILGRTGAGSSGHIKDQVPQWARGYTWICLTSSLNIHLPYKIFPGMGLGSDSVFCLFLLAVSKLFECAMNVWYFLGFESVSCVHIWPKLVRQRRCENFVFFCGGGTFGIRGIGHENVKLPVFMDSAVPCRMFLALQRINVWKRHRMSLISSEAHSRHDGIRHPLVPPVAAGGSRLSLPNFSYASYIVKRIMTRVLAATTVSRHRKVSGRTELFSDCDNYFPKILYLKVSRFWSLKLRF